MLGIYSLTGLGKRSAFWGTTHPIVITIMAPMSIIRTLIANDLLSYREALSMTLRELRPEVEVFESRMVFLDHEVRRLLPNVVICSEVTDLVRDHILHWIELYPNCESRVTISNFGKRRVVDDIRLSDIVSLVDEADKLVRSA